MVQNVIHLMEAARAQKDGRESFVKNAFVLSTCLAKTVNRLVNVTKTQPRAATHTRVNAIVMLDGAQTCAIDLVHF